MYNIIFNNEKYKYLQIYDYFVQEITTNRFRKGLKLPSKRKLSNDLGVSINSISLAYELLEKEGYIKTIERKGTFVLDVGNVIFPHQNITTNNTETFKKYRYDYTTSKVDSTLFPRFTFSKITKDILYNDKTVFEEGLSSGEVSLKIQIANIIYQSRGVKTNYNNIVVASGTEYLMMIISALLPEKTIYGLEDPGYKKIFDCFSNLGKEIELIDTNDPTSTSANCLYLTPSHQFPTGKVYNIASRSKLAKWAVNDNYIIEDDYDCEFKYGPFPIPAIQSMNPSNVIYVSTFSRTISQSMKISYMVLPDKLKAKYDSLFTKYSCSVSKLDQVITARFIAEGYYERLINKSRVLYKKKKELIIKEIKNSLLSKYVRISKENIGLFFLLEFDKRLDEETIIKNCLIEDVKISFISHYAIKKYDGPSKLIMGFSNININDISHSMEKLINIIYNQIIS